MQTKLNEPLLAQCSLRYNNGQADKMHECYITPTKLYFSRKGIVEVISLQSITNVKLIQRVNWLLLILGLAIILVGLLNYKFGIFPEKDAALTTVPAADNPVPAPDPSAYSGNQDTVILTDPDILFKKDSVTLTDPAVLFKEDETVPDESSRLAMLAEWEEDKNYISFGIAMVGAIFLYFGFKKMAFLQIISDRQVILLRIFTVSDEFNTFYHTLLGRMGLTNNSK